MIVPRNVQVHTSTEYDTFRNRIVSGLVNWLLKFASPEYRQFIGGAILYGMYSAARDVAEDREPPPEWFQHDESGPQPGG